MNFKQQLLFELRKAIDHDYYPSLAELAAWLNWPISTTQYRLERMDDDGLVVIFNRGRHGSPLIILPTDDEAPK